MLRLLIKDLAGSRVLEYDRPEVVVGRREGADVRIADAAASRNHCVLRVNGRRVQLIDLGSAHGVTIDGVQVTEAVLKHGEEFCIGQTTIRIEAAGLMLDEPPPPPTAARPALVAHGAAHDFGQELRAAVARTPWYMVSLVFHVFAIWVLAHVPFTIKIVELPVRIEAVKPNQLAEIDTELDEYEPDLPEGDEEILDDSLDDEPAEARPDKADADFSEADYTVDPADIGTGESLTIKLKRPLNLQAEPTNPGAAVDKSNLQSEHGEAQRTVERGMGAGLRGLRGKARKRMIIVIKGDFDKIQNVLDLYKIDYTLVDRDAFARRSYPHAKVICANCARKPSSRHEAKRLSQKIERFVRNGGWFISSDWSIEPYLTGGWPEIVKVVAPKRRQGDTTIGVERVGTSPLVAQAFARNAQTRWWLEETSTFFKVSTRANVLVKSEQALEKYGAGTIAFEFRSGSGRALHLLGHFWQEDGNRAGLVAMHSLIINFLHERFR